MNEPRNHGDLVCVVRRSASFDAERKARDRRRSLVHVVNRDFHVFRAVDVHLLLAPGVLEIVVFRTLLHVLDSQPARTLDLSFEYKKLQHALVSSEKALKCVTCEVVWEWRLSRWVFDFQELVVAMSDWHFKAVLPVDHLAFETSDVLESILSQIVELNDHRVLLSLLLLWGQRPSQFILWHLWERE